jgi:hypothetical protein
MSAPQTVSCKQSRKPPRLKSQLFQELEDQCYPVLKLEVEIQTFAIVKGCKVDLTRKENNGSGHTDRDTRTPRAIRLRSVTFWIIQETTRQCTNPDRKREKEGISERVA